MVKLQLDNLGARYGQRSCPAACVSSAECRCEEAAAPISDVTTPMQIAPGIRALLTTELRGSMIRGQQQRQGKNG